MTDDSELDVRAQDSSQFFRHGLADCFGRGRVCDRTGERGLQQGSRHRRQLAPALRGPEPQRLGGAEVVSGAGLSLDRGPVVHHPVDDSTPSVHD